MYLLFIKPLLNIRIILLLFIVLLPYCTIRKFPEKKELAKKEVMTNLILTPSSLDFVKQKIMWNEHI